jgi:alpha-1,3-glucosyltransferase
MSKGQDLIAAVFFVASLGFKQMALYYAPAIGSYLLAKCIYLGQKNGHVVPSFFLSWLSHQTTTSRRGRLFVHLGVTTVGSLALLFLPFLPPFASPGAILDPITRIFPFSRGLFEDKVANFWCFSNVALKWRNIAGPGTLVKLSTLFTAAGFAPGVVGLLRTGFALRIREDQVPSTTPGVSNVAETKPPTKVEGDDGRGNEASATEPGPLFSLLLFAMLTSSISFFLFSFQVHEKTILVPLLPLALIMVGASGSAESTTWELGMLANNVAVFR